jgi:hypothetical protein
VSYVEPSRADAATAYVTFDGHMTGDMVTYVYKTTDYGATWTSLVSAPLRGYAHVVREDPVAPSLLFVGTEFGLFASVDGGRQWGQFTVGIPNVAVRDLAIHPRDHDLVIATHGRGIYIVDDLTPLRNLTPAVLDSEAAFLPGRPQQQMVAAQAEGANGDAEFVGRDAADAATITYYLKKRHIFGDLKLEISDADGKLVTTLDGGKRRGLNRVSWPMRARAPKVAPAAGIIPNFNAFVGPRVPPGTFTVKMIRGKETLTTTLAVVPDARTNYSAEDRAMQQETVWKLYALLERLTTTVESVTSVRDQARARSAALPPSDALRKRLDALADAMETQRKGLVASQQGEGISGEEKLREEIGMLYGNVNGYDGRPTRSQLDRMGVLSAQLDAAYAQFEGVLAKEGAAVNAALARKKLEPIAAPPRP